MAHILLVDDEKVARSLYGDFLTGAGHQVGSRGIRGRGQRGAGQDIASTGGDRPHPAQSDGIWTLLQYVKLHHANTEVLVITALDKVDPAVRAIKSGAADYLVKPVNPRCWRTR